MLLTLHGLWLRDLSLAWLRGCAADSALEEQKGSPLLLPPPPSSARLGTNLHPLDLSLSPWTQREWLGSALGELGRGRGWLSIAAAIPTSDDRGSPPPCRGPGADPGIARWAGLRFAATNRRSSQPALVPSGRWSRAAELPSPVPVRG